MDYEKLAVELEDYTGADIQALCEEATLLTMSFVYSRRTLTYLLTTIYHRPKFGRYNFYNEMM